MTVVHDPGGPSPSTSRWVAALIVAHCGLLLWFVLCRLIDADEGFYLAAADAVARGLTVYRDFFFPQMPGLPYALSPAAGGGMTTLFVSRFVSLTLSLGTMLLFYASLRSITRHQKTLVLLLGCYALSGLIVAQHSVAKLYAWTDLFVMAAFYAAIRFHRSPSMMWAALTGVCTALAINFRLIFLPLPALFSIHLLQNSRGRRLGTVMAFLLPALLVSVPTLILLVTDTQRVIANNIGFHLIRNPGLSFGDAILVRLALIGKLAVNPQMLVILLSLLLAWHMRKGAPRGAGLRDTIGSDTGLAGSIAAVVTIVYLLPSPPIQQYFVQAIPFALLALALTVGRVWVAGLPPRFERRRTKVIGVAAAIYVLGFIPYAVVFIGGVRQFDGHNRIDNVEAICRLVQSRDEPVPLYSEWPGFPVLAQRPGLPGLEFTGVDLPLDLRDRRKQFLHLPTASSLVEAIERQRPAFCIVIDRPQEAIARLLQENYQPPRAFGRYKVYALADTAP